MTDSCGVQQTKGQPQWRLWIWEQWIFKQYKGLMSKSASAAIAEQILSSKKGPKRLQLFKLADSTNVACVKDDSFVRLWKGI